MADIGIVLIVQVKKKSHHRFWKGIQSDQCVITLILGNGFINTLHTYVTLGTEQKGPFDKIWFFDLRIGF